MFDILFDKNMTNYKMKISGLGYLSIMSIINLLKTQCIIDILNLNII